jgi:hypothetical protein
MGWRRGMVERRTRRRADTTGRTMNTIARPPAEPPAQPAPICPSCGDPWLPLPATTRKRVVACRACLKLIRWEPVLVEEEP